MASLRPQLTGNVQEFAPEHDAWQVDTPHRRSAQREEPVRRGGRGILAFSIVLAMYWIGIACASLWGYFGLHNFSHVDTQLVSFFATVTVLPPLFFVAYAVALARAKNLADIAQKLGGISNALLNADETAVQSAQSVGRAIRRELDALSSGVDGVFGRLRALETALENRLAQLEDASARAGVKAEGIAHRLRTESENIERLAARLDESSAGAAEMLGGRCAQLDAMIESASGGLKAAGQMLDMQVLQFRDAAQRAATAPHAAAVELDRQAKQLEAGGETAVARAEFVLARQERQRTAMCELLVRLNEEAEAYQGSLESHRKIAEQATAALSGETQRLNESVAEGTRRIEITAKDTAARSAEIASDFAKSADLLKDTCEIAAAGIAKLIESLREAALQVATQFADSAANAKRRSTESVRETTEEYDRLLRVSVSVADGTEKARAALALASEEAQQHILRVPGIAAQEAQRVRETLRAETEQMLDITARTIATLQARGRRRTPEERELGGREGGGAPARPREGLRGLARLITGPKRRVQNDREQPASNHGLCAVLAAADSGIRPAMDSGGTAHMSVAQAVLADLAGDLDMGDETDDPALWRRYLEGDRAAFARSLAASIGPDSIDRITANYRDKPEFHIAAEAYIAEFEAMLARARKDDSDGFLASTLLTADTGKIYLTLAYALGRLE